ncbi:hypothetical protein [Rhizobium leguminosarum]|uniref:hypothetical protein n=1 Tax=Rhizobium leguminosarum TaxID=384 RepID=UPI001C96F4AF|nr:hypothetical protein [Rhizobium leguminosarum]MBY5327647.1 hypothetical protein [Rhizobium leguminosarum]
MTLIGCRASSMQNYLNTEIRSAPEQGSTSSPGHLSVVQLVPGMYRPPYLVLKLRAGVAEKRHRLDANLFMTVFAGNRGYGNLRDGMMANHILRHLFLPHFMTPSGPTIIFINVFPDYL